MSDARRAVASVVGAALLPAAVVGMAAIAPLVNDRFISVVDGRILTVAWWVSVPLSVAAAVIWSRKAWAGVVLGVACVPAFILTLALVDTTSGTADLMLEPGMWVSSILLLAVPWAVGMIFGTTSLNRRPKRIDGTSPHGGGAGIV